MMNNTISSLILLLVFFLPGISIQYALRARLYNLEQALIYSFGISAAYLVLMNLILLRFGLFNVVTETILILLPVGAALLVKFINKELIASYWQIRTNNIIFIVIIFLIFGSILLFTPKWYFLISPNMDAGNYEVYSNHFWKTGDLYFHVDAYSKKNIPLEYLISRNTWAFAEESTIGKPNYMYGYPVLLGLAKLIYGSPNISWVINGVFSLFSAAIVGSLLLRLTKSKWVSMAILFALCFTPLFFYYSKQVMSEQVALFGFLLFCYSLFENNNKQDVKGILGAVSGITLVLLMKLDSFIVPILILVALIIVWIDKTQYDKRIKLDPILIIGIGIAVLVCALLTIWLCNPRYVSHFSISSIKPYGDTVFILIYTISLLIGYAIIAYLYSQPSNVLRNIFVKYRFAQSIYIFLIIAWVSFVVWNIGVRPVGMPFEQDHNAYNIHRLLTVFSPLFLLITLFSLPFIIKQASGTVKLLLIVGMLGLGYLTFNSNHSPPDIWWMRRYLVLLLPTVAISIGALYRLAIINKWLSVRTAITYTLGAAIISIVWQVPHMKVLLKHKVNESSPEQIIMLKSHIPEQALVITTISNSVIRGTLNTFRSLHPGHLLLNVPHDQVTHVISMYPEQKAIALITQQELAPSENVGREFELVNKGYFHKQWVNDFGLLLEDPVRKKSSQYYLYLSAE